MKVLCLVKFPAEKYLSIQISHPQTVVESRMCAVHKDVKSYGGVNRNRFAFTKPNIFRIKYLKSWWESSRSAFRGVMFKVWTYWLDCVRCVARRLLNFDWLMIFRLKWLMMPKPAENISWQFNKINNSKAKDQIGDENRGEEGWMSFRCPLLFYARWRGIKSELRQQKENLWLVGCAVFTQMEKMFLISRPFSLFYGLGKSIFGDVVVNFSFVRDSRDTKWNDCRPYQRKVAVKSHHKKDLPQNDDGKWLEDSFNVNKWLRVSNEGLKTISRFLSRAGRRWWNFKIFNIFVEKFIKFIKFCCLSFDELIYFISSFLHSTSSPLTTR